MYMSTGEKIVAALFILIFGPMLLFIPAAIFVYIPVTSVAEEKCLERGYPKASVTWNLKRYCTNLDGSVTIKVEQLP
jgi:hypothetical protein